MKCSPSVPERKFAIFKENRSRAHGSSACKRRHFVLPIVIHLVTPTKALRTSHSQTSVFFLFCFCLFPLGNALLGLAHLSIYLLTKCSRSQSEEKFSIFSEKDKFHRLSRQRVNFCVYSNQACAIFGSQSKSRIIYFRLVTNCK